MKLHVVPRDLLPCKTLAGRDVCFRAQMVLSRTDVCVRIRMCAHSQCVAHMCVFARRSAWRHRCVCARREICVFAHTLCVFSYTSVSRGCVFLTADVCRSTHACFRTHTHLCFRTQNWAHMCVCVHTDVCFFRAQMCVFSIRMCVNAQISGST